MENKIEEIKQTLENRLKRLDVYSKMDQIKADRTKYDQESEKRELENQKLTYEVEEKRKGVGGFSTPIGQLLMVAMSYRLDKGLTPSEPAIVPLLDEQELEIVKKKLFKLIDKL